MRVGVVGTGRMGRAIAERLMAELALGIYEEASASSWAWRDGATLAACWPGRGRP
jgi:3-hydroxyisobutyrate dehydrogenase-like beta-hydroxyacid dehydrogenase